jgi:hypothetical protein
MWEVTLLLRLLPFCVDVVISLCMACCSCSLHGSGCAYVMMRSDVMRWCLCMVCCWTVGSLLAQLVVSHRLARRFPCKMLCMRCEWP